MIYISYNNLPWIRHLFLFGGERRCIAENKGEKQEDSRKEGRKKGKEEKKKGGAVSVEQAEHPPWFDTDVPDDRKKIHRKRPSRK